MTFFIVVGAIGFVLTLISMFGHELGEHDFDHEHDFDDGDAGHSSPSIFSFRTIVVFMTGFGAVGAVCSYFGVNMVLSIILGTISGVVLAAIAWWLMSTVMRQQSNSAINLNSFIGHSAVVTTAIPINGTGEILVEFNAKRHYLHAKCSTPQLVKERSLVKIISTHSGVASVEFPT